MTEPQEAVDLTVVKDQVDRVDAVLRINEIGAISDTATISRVESIIWSTPVRYRAILMGVLSERKDRLLDLALENFNWRQP